MKIASEILMSDQRNWLERLGDKIPGYGGYVSKERRRDADKLHREHLAERLRAAKQPLNEVMRELSSSGRLFEVGPVDRVLKKLDQIENRVRFASYGYAGFFDAVKIEEPQLDAIYRFDLSLVEKVDEFERLAREISSKSSTADGLKQSAAEIERAADDLNSTFDDRSRAIENFRPDDAAEGRPMFS
ncbi:MAG: hypothetical protein QOE46_812 [Acidobacteriota bacterium]|jgi:hypothetical protein|nr:hypothetical protein [Acidobacteriota bacterium]